MVALSVSRDGARVLRDFCLACTREHVDSADRQTAGSAHARSGRRTTPPAMNLVCANSVTTTTHYASQQAIKATPATCLGRNRTQIPSNTRQATVDFRSSKALSRASRNRVSTRHALGDPRAGNAAAGVRASGTAASRLFVSEDVVAALLFDPAASHQVADPLLARVVPY